jgi:hypothetical protein
MLFQHQLTYTLICKMLPHRNMAVLGICLPPICLPLQTLEGEVQVTIRGEHRGTMGPGKLFGELALLYNCTRTATVKALTDTKVWTLDRASFQAIMMNTGIVRQSQHVKFLRSYAWTSLY